MKEDVKKENRKEAEAIESRASSHQPVMVKEVLEALQVEPGRVFLDGTFGRGGHAARILEKGATLYAMDRDAQAVGAGLELQKKFGAAFKLEQGDFRNWAAWKEKVPEGFDGLLLDLGMSSPQIDQAERGFSFNREGPLDMRMDQSSGVSAEKIIGESSEQELEVIFKTYGEERYSRGVARAIVRARAHAPIRTTLDLAALVATVIHRRAGELSHPAARVFQALRIVVNDELKALEQALAAVRVLLKPGGRLAVLTFHSLEDRIVKQFIAHASRPEFCPAGVPFGVANPDYFLIRLKDRVPSAEEIGANSRARSARLRIAQRVPYGA